MAMTVGSLLADLAARVRKLETTLAGHTAR